MASKKGGKSSGQSPIKKTKSDPPPATNRDDAPEDKRKHGAKGRKHSNEDDEGERANKGECRSPWDNVEHSKEPKPENKFPRYSVERLDQDFFLFASQAHSAMKRGQLSRKHEDIASRWLTKLLTEHYPDMSSKKNRNIFLSNLLLQVADGALSGPLLKPPPQGPLVSAAMAFGLSAPPDRSRLDNAGDVMLNPKDYMHTSTDGRTYMATKSLEGDIGACAFIGVSVGGDEPQWVKPSGEKTCVPERDDLIVTKIEARGDKAVFRGVGPGKSIHSIAARRKPKNEREGLVAFYESVLHKISREIDSPTLAYDGPHDPLIQRLIHNLTCEEPECDPEGTCDFTVLLPMLQTKIKGLLQAALDRDKEIERISRQTNVVDNDAQLVDVSSMKAFDPQDDIWKAAITEEPNPETLNQLKYNYPVCINASLLMLLERQRQIIIDQEKKTHEQLVTSMRAELMFDVKDSVVKYQEAQRQYNRVSKALKQTERIDQERKTMNVEPAGASQGASDVSNYTKELMMKKQLADAQRKLDAARQNAEDIDDKMEELNCKIADVQKRNIEANEALKKDATRWSKIICQMKADLRAQEREIERLNKMLEAYERKECCIY